MSRPVWRELGLRLRRIGLTSAFCASMWQASPRSYPGLHWPVSEWRAKHSAAPAATAFRVFCLGQPAPEQKVRSALSDRLVDIALEAGLLLRAGDQIGCLLDLRTLGDLYVFCDRRALHADAVFGVGPGNDAFHGIVSARWPADLVLDVGCGAGAAALLASRHARHVVATDLNPRALDLLTTNAALNDVSTIETRLGDLFEPAAGEVFDLVMAQLPYVPQPAGMPDVAYLFGGPTGTEPVGRLFAELDERLQDGGRAAVVYEAAVDPTGGDLDPQAQLPARSGVRTLRLLGSVVHADVYATRFALPWLRRDVARFDAAVTAMRDHLAQIGVAGVRPAVAVVEKRTGSRGWRETVKVEGTLWDAVGPASLWRLLRGVSADTDETWSEVTVDLPVETLLVESLADPGRVRLALPAGYLAPSGPWTRAELELLRTRPGRDLARRALRAGLIAVPDGRLR